MTTQREATITVSKYLRIDGTECQEENEETISAHVFQTEPAVVTMEKGLTRSIGEFESARVTVRLQVPCYVEQLHATVQGVDQYISQILGGIDMKISGMKG